MVKKLIIAFLLSLAMLHSFAQNKKITQKDLKHIAKYMSGAFTSQMQAKSDTDYYNIALHMQPIWETDNNGYWLYVEQAMATALDKPYRQRVYHLTLENDTTILSKVYEIKSAKNYIGGWNDTNKLIALNKDSLIDRQGCGIYLHKKSKKEFSGTTPEKQCLSSLRGATYATSEVSVYNNKIISWDRGWSAADKQVWGAEKGGYIFIKEFISNKQQNLKNKKAKDRMMQKNNNAAILIHR
jgi:CpeT protein